MKKRLCLFLIMVLGASLLSGCSGAVKKASLDSEFTLSVGQSARIESESMDIKFIGVTADSRCATGVVCVRAGDVTCEVEIVKNGISNRITLTQPSPSDDNTFENYFFMIAVSPYPEAGKQIDKNDYRLKITITKN
jgi:hypothetical protein